MKTCPVCALDVDDAFLFCPDDGSSLDVPTDASTAREVTAVVEPHNETAGAVVLYCPTCAAEYPLTFTACPVHGVPLTKHRIPRLPDRGLDRHEYEKPVESRALSDAQRFRRVQSNFEKRLTTLDLKRPQMEGALIPSVIISLDDDKEQEQDTSGAQDDSVAAPVVAAGEILSYRGPVTEAHAQGFERQGFRIAAIATVIALIVLGVVAMYAVISNLSRRPSSSAVQIASTKPPEPPPFVPTPQEAQNYKEEEAAVPLPSTSVAPPTERLVERGRSERPALATSQNAPKTTVVQPPTKAPTAPSSPAPVTPTRISNPSMPALPRGDSGGFDARLVRVRSRQTPGGFRYDLTFNMQEQAGRAAQWQRVLISTRSASGVSHSEAVPFSHRLGAAGALTFTISVELTGRSEADWQGRIVCTTLGWDNKGAPVQSSFGANVTP